MTQLEEIHQSSFVMMSGLLLLSLVSPGLVAVDDTVRGDPSVILCLLVTGLVSSSLSLSRVIQSALSVENLLAAAGGGALLPRPLPMTSSSLSSDKVSVTRLPTLETGTE